jgi:hypothetical protein
VEYDDVPQNDAPRRTSIRLAAEDSVEASADAWYG